MIKELENRPSGKRLGPRQKSDEFKGVIKCGGEREAVVAFLGRSLAGH